MSLWNRTWKYLRPMKYLTSCAGKVCYGARSGAEKACIGMAAKGSPGLEAYACRFCGAWHIGHKPGDGKFRVSVSVKRA